MATFEWVQLQRGVYKLDVMFIAAAEMRYYVMTFPLHTGSLTHYICDC